MDVPIIGAAKSDQQKIVEVCRSFAYKLNLANHGGPQFESADFFASRKIQCAEEDAEWVSQQVFEECVTEVRASVTAFIEEMKRRRSPKNAGKAADFEKWQKEQTA